MVQVPPGHTPSSVAPAGHALGCYYVNIFTGSVQRQCNPLNAIALAPLGYVGVNGTPAAAFNAFPTFDEAKAFAAGVGAATGGGTPGGSLPNTSGGGGFSGGSGSGQASGSEWQHLLVRGAEFIIGALLIYVGIQAVVVKSKPGQTVIQTTAGVARVVR